MIIFSRTLQYLSVALIALAIYGLATEGRWTFWLTLTTGVLLLGANVLNEWTERYKRETKRMQEADL